MKKVIYIASVIVSIMLLCLFLVNANQAIDLEDSPEVENDYRTILYTCTTGETIERCWYNGGGCDISGQWLCFSEQ